jgi:FlaA1/EpsC-like NDP-sugar epimerase
MKAAAVRRGLHWLMTGPHRPLLVLALDGSIACFSLWTAMFLRFEGEISEKYREALPAFLVLLVGSRVLASGTFRVHRWSFRFSSLADGARVGVAGVFGTGAFLASLYLLGHLEPPRSVVILELLLTTLLMAALRFSPRLAGMYATDWLLSHSDGAVRTIIVGAGSAGEMLLRDLQRSRAHRYQVVGFVDDDRRKRKMVVGGKTVLGGIDELPLLARRHQVEQVLLAIPRLHGRRIRQILSLCADLKLRFKILPASFVNLAQRAPSAVMQDLTPEDLLPREPIDVNGGNGSLPIHGRSALVTGAGGSIGSEICTQLLKSGLAKLVMVDINENPLYMMKYRFERDFPGASVSIEVADIRDQGRMRTLFGRYRPQDVFHAAAHKHVPLMESAPCEAVKNNVLGTRNVAEAAGACGAQRFVYISTDKAVRPTSVMGASKRVGEEIVLSMSRRYATRFCCVRFGNVLGSAGSVVPLFREQIAAGGPVLVTHPEVRRYFMTIGEAIALVLKVTYSDYEGLCVLDMGEQIRILDLARNMITMLGLVPDQDIQIIFTGLRPGEKLFEELLTEEEERTRRVDGKILLAESPPPHKELDARVQELVEAAGADDAARVRGLLFKLVSAQHRSFREDLRLPRRHDVSDAVA